MASLQKGLYTVAGGKGGTGKSFVTANMGAALATAGNKVLVIDADFGCSDLHHFMAIQKPEYSFSNFFLNEVTDLRQLLIDTEIDNLKMIASGARVYGLANMHFFKKVSLLRQIGKLEFDYIFIDLGAGISFNNVDFFNLSNEGIIVLNNNPLSRQNALIFIKTALYRKLIQNIRKNKPVWQEIELHLKTEKKDAFEINTILNWIIENSEEMVQVLRDLLFQFRPKLIYNKVRESDLSNGTIEQNFNSLKTVTRQHLQIDLDYLGAIRNDENVEKATQRGDLFFVNNMESDAAKDFRVMFSKEFKESLAM